MRIYVGNMSYSTSSEDLRQAFERYGAVESAEVVMERGTSRSRGFGFVEMPDETEARNAIAQLNGRELDGRTLKVNEAKPRFAETRGNYRF